MRNHFSYRSSVRYFHRLLPDVEIPSQAITAVRCRADLIVRRYGGLKRLVTLFSVLKILVLPGETDCGIQENESEFLGGPFHWPSIARITVTDTESRAEVVI